MIIFFLDGYVDEPSCLGVPPYISPQVRYAYGALRNSGIADNNITYCTADMWRDNQNEHKELMERSDLVFIYAGTTVPGRYLTGKPLTITEISNISSSLTYPKTILGGPLIASLTEKVANRFELKQSIDLFCDELAAITLYEYITNKKVSHSNIDSLLSEWAVLGANLTVKHPNFPYVMCELETFRGCPRPVNCAFCSERFKKIKYVRQTEDIINEVEALSNLGNKYFRLGCQTDLLSYGAKFDGPPNTKIITELYSGIRRVAPKLRVLHMDNVNPATIANYPNEARKALEIIVKHNTPGDTAAFGMESADPNVLKANNINCTPQQVYDAIRIMNEIGGIREEGIPKLLPGVNLLHGLHGENVKTMQQNYNFLQEVRNSGFLLRRINIRQVLETGNYSSLKVNKYQFNKYKEEINSSINLPMLKKVFPTGTILKNVITEKNQHHLTWGRQLGSYPILIGIVGQHQLQRALDIVVVDHGFRSLTGLPIPFDINKATLPMLVAIPGIGQKIAKKIILNRPFQSWLDFENRVFSGINNPLQRSWLIFNK